VFDGASIQISKSPVIGATPPVTLIVVVRKQPVGSIYLTTVVPGDMPVKTPVTLSMVPTAGVALLHVPPAVVLVSESVPETQMEVPPAIGAGSGLTVNAMTRKQPDGNV
jgi:hypothetical protein